jgi:signal transduction histidine kinase
MNHPSEEGRSVLELTGRSRQSFRGDEGRFRALAELSATLAESMTDVGSLPDRVVELVSRFLGDAAALLLLDNSGRHLRVAAVYDADAHARNVIGHALRSSPTKGESLGFQRVAVRTARPRVLDWEDFDAATSLMTPETRLALCELGLHTALLCPLRVRGRVIGSLSLWRYSDGGPYSERDLWFTQELADRAALAIENARLVERLHAEVQERKHSEKRLRHTADLLQREGAERKALIEHLVAAQEEERRRIAVDVHDDSIQAMAAISLRLQILRRHALSRAAAEGIGEIEAAVMKSIARLRNLLIRLEATSLDKEGLAHAIDRCIEDLFPDNSPGERVLSRLKTEPPGYVQVVLFRVAQEAITNVRKHARASKFSAVLSEEHQGTMLLVKDNGIGFDPGDLAEHSLPGHMGLRAMQQRAQVAGGWLRVDSEPGKGTTIRCWLPAMNGVPRAID